jgi:hypothetical protein
MDPTVKKTAPADAEGFGLFIRLWGVALVAHVIGNWSQPDIPTLVGFANLGVGILGILLISFPSRVGLLLAAAATVVSLIAEMPFTGNHWLIVGLISLAILLSYASPSRLFPAARLILLVFYLFAAFAKFNSGFFDPTVSCAVFYANQSLASLGLPTISSQSLLSEAFIWGSALIESLIPILLIVRRTRFVGVALASLFHILISIDLDQHFYDFTSVLIPLLFLFLPPESITRLTSLLRSFFGAISRIPAILFGVVGCLLVAMAVTVPTDVSVELLKSLPFLLWIPISLSWVYGLWKARHPGGALRWQPGLAGIAVGLTFLNGLTPYTEVKTAYGFNMYANLQTAGGESNHFLIRRTLTVRDGYEGPVAIVSSSDRGLEEYARLQYLVAYPQLRQYLSTRPDVSLTYVRDGETIRLGRAADQPDFTARGPWWWRFLPLRAIDRLTPPRCQDIFLVAL